MADQRISVHDRVLILDQLNACAWWLNRLAGWLGQRGVETEADIIEQAARNLLASCWLLERPLRANPPPEVWKGTPGQQQPSYQAAPGYPQQR
jgi:hypothetical protein